MHQWRHSVLLVYCLYNLVSPTVYMNKPLALRYVHLWPVPDQAANALQVAKMCDAFVGAGASVSLVTPGPQLAGHYDEIERAYALKRTFEVEKVSLLGVPGSVWLYALRAVATRPVHEVIYTRSITIAAAAARLGRPTAMEMHEPPGRERLAKRLGWLARQRNHLQTVFTTDSLRRRVVQMVPETATRSMVCQNGGESPPQDLRPAEAAMLGDFRVGYVGHLYPGKGMEIIAVLARRCPWAHFHIVGGRPEDVSMWREQLSDCQNLTFHGHLPQTEVARCLAAMHVALAPYQDFVGSIDGKGHSAAWTSPLKVFDYMAHGKAIIASDLQTIREVLREGGNALLRSNIAHDEWIAALATLRDDLAMRARLGEQARADFLTRHTWDARARNIVAALQRCSSA